MKPAHHPRAKPEQLLFLQPPADRQQNGRSYGVADQCQQVRLFVQVQKLPGGTECRK